MVSLVDQIGHEVNLPYLPKKIVSVVPSQTELLHDFGLEEQVVGITKFCIHPNSWFESKQRVGGTKSLKLESIAALEPDLIIANKEENTEDQIVELQQNYPVYTSDINCLDDSLEMIKDLGLLTGCQSESASLCEQIVETFSVLQPYSGNGNKVLYLIWKSPHMSVGEDTFIHDMLNRCGLENVMGGANRYPEISTEMVKHLAPNFVFLSSEPFPFSDKHMNEFESLFPTSKVMLVDGEYFSWYGSRLKEAPKYFGELLNKMP